MIKTFIIAKMTDVVLSNQSWSTMFKDLHKWLMIWWTADLISYFKTISIILTNLPVLWICLLQFQAVVFFLKFLQFILSFHESFINNFKFTKYYSIHIYVFQRFKNILGRLYSSFQQYYLFCYPPIYLNITHRVAKVYWLGKFAVKICPLLV